MAQFFKREPATGEVYRRLLEDMSEGVSLSTEEWVIVLTNPAMDRMFGYERGQLVGRRTSVLNAYSLEETRERMSEVRKQLAKTGAFRGEWHNRRRDGSELFTVAKISSVVVGGTPHWLCVQDDITSERQIRLALGESEARLRLAIDAGRMAVWHVDFANQTLDTSPELNRLLGFPEDARPTLKETRANYYPGDVDRVQQAGIMALSCAFH